MWKPIAAAVLGTALALGLGIAPAQAGGAPAFVSRYEYRHVYLWEVESQVEQQWDHSGIRLMAWTDADGNRRRIVAYPTSTPLGWAAATYVKYSLDPKSDPHRTYAWVLSSKLWCIRGPVCSAALPQIPRGDL